MSTRRGYVAAGLAMIVFAAIFAYAFYQLLAIQRTLSTFTGENMLWNVTQTEREARKLAEAILLIPMHKDSDNLTLKLDILMSRMNILNDRPQNKFYVQIDDEQNVQEFNRIVRNFKTAFQFAQTDGFTNSMALYDILVPAFERLGQLSNKVMIQQRVLAGDQRDRQLQAIYLVMTSIAGLLASGVALSWLLVTNIRALNTAHATLSQYNEQLENTVAARTAALSKSLANERETIDIYKNFLTTVSHQFRTPITIIDMIAQRFVRRPGDISRRVLVERSLHIRTAVKRLIFIIDSTINNDRFAERGLDLSFSDVNFIETVSKACSYHKDIYTERQINLTFPGRQVIISGDVTLLEQILINLISNAEKYSPQSAPINIAIRIDEAMIICSVTDYGIGISAEDQPKIFDRFFRAANVSHLAGSGLGLSLSSMLARLHGGSITCQSSMNVGTTFELQLPLNGI